MVVKLACVFTAFEAILKFLLKRPNTALDVTFWIWLFHFRSEVMVYPTYFVLSVIQSTWPWSLYMLGGSIFDLPLWRPTLIVKHFPTLNSINQVSSHLAIMSISVWSRLMSFLSIACLYKIQSSANRRPVLWVTSTGRNMSKNVKTCLKQSLTRAEIRR